MRRPIFLNPLHLHFPVGALTSVMHRITGMLLAIAIPVSIYLFDRSLQGPQAYEAVTRLCQSWPLKVAGIASVWALSHHLLAGIRHLLSDVDVGSQLPAARRSAWIVNVGAVAVALLAAGVML